MAGFVVKKYSTIVMDGSDADALNFITEFINQMTKQRYGETVCHPLDSTHPTMMVIEARTTGNIYEVIQEMLSELYPGLCVFNPPI